MADKRDYYEILGVDRNASAEELKSAYRKQAVRYHPDRNQGDKEAEEIFKECSEAYEVLSDPEKRQVYDQYGHAGLSNQGYQGFGGFDDIFSSFSDIFSDMFGFSSRSGRGYAGADLRYDLEIDFETAVFGGQAELDIPRATTCTECDGSGAAPGSSPQPCGTCQGRGQVYTSQGFLRIATTCPTCRGRGQVIPDPCPECRGQGQVQETGRVKVKIPGGVDNGSRLRLRGEGEAGREGGPAGDLFVVLHVAEHEHFARHGDDLVFSLELGMARAALGCEPEVPLLGDDGSAIVKIPAGTQTGQIFRIRGRGVPRLRGRGRGDMIVQVIVRTPTKLTGREKELLKELAQIEASKNGKNGFFSRLFGKKEEPEQESEWA